MQNSNFEWKVGGVGTVMGWPVEVDTPDGWLELDGRCWPAEASPQLYSIWSHSRAPGDPQGSFRIPNARPMVGATSLIKLIVRAL